MFLAASLGSFGFKEVVGMIGSSTGWLDAVSDLTGIQSGCGV